MAFFCIINHGASKIHTYMSRCLLHLPQVKFLRTELLGSAVHMSRYLIYKVCQGDSIESAPTSTRASLALYFCSNNLCAEECALAGEGTRGGQRLTLECFFLLLSTLFFLSSDRVSHWSQSLLSHRPGWKASKSWVHLQMRATMTSSLRGSLRSELTSLCLQSKYFTWAIPLTPKQLFNLH